MRIDDDHDRGTFIFRTMDLNSIRTLAARLSYYQAASGKRLAYLPLELRLRGKSTTQSHRGRPSTIWTSPLVTEGLSVTEAIPQAKETEKEMKDAGYDQVALEGAARKGFDNALFEYHEEEIAEIMDEFYPSQASQVGGGDSATLSPGDSSVKVWEIRSLLETKTTGVEA